MPRTSDTSAYPLKTPLESTDRLTGFADALAGKPVRTFDPADILALGLTTDAFKTAVRAQVEAMLRAGAGITLTPSGTGPLRVLDVINSGGGGGGGGGVAIPGVGMLFDFNLTSGAPTLTGGSPPPAAPTLTNLTLVFDFDFGAPAAGAFPTSLASQAGSAGTAACAVGGGAPIIGTVTGARRGVIFDGVDDRLAVTNVLATLIPTNPDNEMIICVIGRASNRDNPGTFFDITRDNQSGAFSLNRYSFTHGGASAETFIGANQLVWRRADGANRADSSLGTSWSLGTTLRMVGRSGPSTDTTNRGMLNGGTKSTSPSRSVTSSGGNWNRLTLGALMADTAQTTWSRFLTGAIERVFGYVATTPGAANDAALDAIEAAMATYYS